MLAISAYQLFAGIFTLLGCVGAFYLLRLTNRQQSDWDRIQKALPRNRQEEWIYPAKSLEQTQGQMALFAKACVPFVFGLYLVWIFSAPHASTPQTAPAPVPDASMVPSLVKTNTSAQFDTNIHRFYREKLDSVGRVQSDLIQKLASAQNTRSNLMGRASQVEAERNHLMSELQASEQTETFLKEQLAAADELQTQLVAELSLAQQYMEALSLEVAQTRMLHSQLMEDLDVIIEKLGPSPQETDVEAFSVTGNVRHELYLARQRLKDVALEVLNAKSRFTTPPSSDDMLQVERLPLTNPP